MEDVKEPITKKESTFGIQDYLSMGYVFLLILGVLHQTIYYNFLGINIFEYSSILDVLISPVSVITGDIKLLIGLVVCIILAMVYAQLLPKYYSWLSKKKKYQSGKKKEKLEKSLNAFKSGSKQMMLVMIALYIIGGFIGFGIGGGSRTKEKINNNEIEITHQLTFENGKIENIKMLGKNSLYVFFVTKNDKNIKIAPIDGNINLIAKLKEE